MSNWLALLPAAFPGPKALVLGATAIRCRKPSSLAFEAAQIYVVVVAAESAATKSTVASNLLQCRYFVVFAEAVVASATASTVSTGLLQRYNIDADDDVVVVDVLHGVVVVVAVLVVVVVVVAAASVVAPR
jgi:hypothetical protein